MAKKKINKSFNPLVSIIIPVYNGANYVGEAIDSALAQTYKNIEIIVVNDGSVDNSEEIIKSYGNKLRYFKKENGGVSTALNLGIKKSKGEYISWLSHDDLYYPEKVESQIGKIKMTGDKNVILYSDFCEINESLMKIRDILLPDLDENYIRPFLSFESGLYLHGCSLLIPKTAFLKYDYFDESKKCTQDYDLWFKFSYFYKFIHVNEILVKSRIHKDQDSNKKSNLKIKEADQMRSQFVQKMSNKNFLDYFKKTGNMWNIYEQFRNLGFEEMANSFYKKIDKVFNTQLIPKKIHYFWFGRGEMSDLNKKCISSWKEYAPDFEIIKWDESNCNIRENKYVYEAYKNKKWAFVSDYFRFKILYKYGGFYCDTDAEITNNLDILRQYDFFLGFERKEYVQVGFFGSKSKTLVLKKILDTYKKDFFIKKDGSLKTNFTSPMRMTKLLVSEFNLNLDGKEQLLNKNIKVYPMNFFTIDVNDGKNISKHHYDNSWGYKTDIPYSYILTKEYFKNLFILENIGFGSGLISQFKNNEQLYLDRVYASSFFGRLIVRIYLKLKKIFK